MVSSKLSGIYRISNVLDNKFYIGSAINIEKRWKDHIYRLNHGLHENGYLQRAWTKFGQHNFSFSIVKLVDNKEKLIKEEQSILDKLKPEYNLCIKANSQFGLKRSEETRKKISTAQRKRWASILSEQRIREIENERYQKSKRVKREKKGFKLSDETKKRMSLAKKGKIRKPFTLETRRRISVAITEWHKKRQKQEIVLNYN